MNADDLHVLAGEYVLGTLGRTPRRGGGALGNDAAPYGGGTVATETSTAQRAGSAGGSRSSAFWSRIETSVAARVASGKGVRPCGGAHRSNGNWWNSLRACGVASRRPVSRRRHSWASWWSASWRNHRGQATWWSWSGRRTKSPGWVVQAGRTATGAADSRSARWTCRRQSPQFWTKRQRDWKGPVSLGLVRPGESKEVSLDKLPPLEPNQLFEITLEPYNGSPLDRPHRPDPFHRGGAVKIYLSANLGCREVVHPPGKLLCAALDPCEGLPG